MISQTALRAATFKGWRNCCHRREMQLVTLVAVCCETFLNREMWTVNRNCLGCVHGTGIARCFFSYLLLLLPSLPLNFFFFFKKNMALLICMCLYKRSPTTRSQDVRSSLRSDTDRLWVHHHSGGEPTQNDTKDNDVLTVNTNPSKKTEPCGKISSMGRRLA